MAHTRSRGHHAGGRSSGCHDIGRCLGLLALVGGTAWCLKKHAFSPHSQTHRALTHRGSRTHHFPTGAESRGGFEYRHLLMAAFGAAAAGLLASSVVPRVRRSSRSEVNLTGNVIINRPPEEVYQFWRRFENLPEVMSFLEYAGPGERNLYRWRARGPVGPAFEWMSEITEDDPGKRLAWRSVEGSDLHTWGKVTFEPNEDHESTLLAVNFTFCPPANATGAALKFLSGLESTVLNKNLRNLKSKLEAGEIATARRYNSVRHGQNGGDQ